jgi:hypothetical protein
MTAPKKHLILIGIVTALLLVTALLAGCIGMYYNGYEGPGRTCGRSGSRQEPRPPRFRGHYGT